MVNLVVAFERSVDVDFVASTRCSTVSHPPGLCTREVADLTDEVKFLGRSGLCGDREFNRPRG